MNPNFSDGVDSLYRDANILVLLSLAIALSPEDSSLKSAAPGLIAAGRKLAEVQNLDEAKAAAEEVKNAVASTADTSSLRWEKTVHLSPLMKKGLPNITTEIKRLGRNEKTLSRSGNLDKVVGATATLTVIAVGCRPNVDETLAPTEEAQWLEYCDRLYDASLELNKAAAAFRDKTGSFDDFSAAFKAVDATCNTTCHASFGGTTN